MQEPWLAFDTETTGLDYDSARILSVAVVAIDPVGAAPPQTRIRYLNWDVDIPEESRRIHGLTREWLAANGSDPATVIGGLIPHLAKAMATGHNLIGMNLVFDLTMLDRNARRLGIPTLSDELGDIRPVVDAFVLDKYVDPFRKGKRNLEALANLYRVPWDGEAHHADFDALAAARVAYRIGRMYPQIGGMSAGALHDLQVEAKADQDRSFAEWAASQGKPVYAPGAWPLIPDPGQGPT